MKANDNKKPKNISIRPSVVETAEKKAKRLAKKMEVDYISISQLIEEAINQYNPDL